MTTWTRGRLRGLSAGSKRGAMRRETWTVGRKARLRGARAGLLGASPGCRARGLDFEARGLRGARPGVGLRVAVVAGRLGSPLFNLKPTIEVFSMLSASSELRIMIRSHLWICKNEIYAMNGADHHFDH